MLTWLTVLKFCRLSWCSASRGFFSDSWDICYKHFNASCFVIFLTTPNGVLILNNWLVSFLKRSAELNIAVVTMIVNNYIAWRSCTSVVLIRRRMCNLASRCGSVSRWMRRLDRWRRQLIWAQWHKSITPGWVCQQWLWRMVCTGSLCAWNLDPGICLTRSSRPMCVSRRVRSLRGLSLTACRRSREEPTLLSLSHLSDIQLTPMSKLMLHR